MFGDDSLAGSYHNDVLHAEPSSAEGKAKLVEEIKSRAKGCIASKNFPVAVQLYTKAVDVMSDGSDPSGCAILRANRSMCYLTVNNAALALEDAVEAEKLDPSYVKVYYRKAAALKSLQRFSEAKEAVLQGLTRKPDDKDMQGLLTKIEMDISEKGKAAGLNQVKAARTTVKTGTSTAKAGSGVPAATTRATASTCAEEEEEETLSNVRGYKKTADGRVTTFFNNELDEAAKRLIGDIAPKKLEAVEPSVALEATTANGASVWNSAGTYEERQLSPWASAELRRSLSALAAHIPSPAGVPQVECADLSVAEVENVVGDAQVSMVRGKKKYLADYCADLKWVLSLRVKGGALDTVSGRLQLLDISADDEYEVGAVEVTHFNGNTASLHALPQHAGLMVKDYVKAGPGAQPLGLQTLVHNALLRFCADLKAK